MKINYGIAIKDDMEYDDSIEIVINDTCWDFYTIHDNPPYNLDLQENNGESYLSYVEMLNSKVITLFEWVE